MDFCEDRTALLVVLWIAFCDVLHSIIFCSEGWERLGLFEYYAKKAEIRQRVENKAKDEGKTLEDLIENVYIEEDDEEEEEEEEEKDRRKRNLKFLTPNNFTREE